MPSRVWWRRGARSVQHGDGVFWARAGITQKSPHGDLAAAAVNDSVIPMCDARPSDQAAAHQHRAHGALGGELAGAGDRRRRLGAVDRGKAQALKEPRRGEWKETERTN